jgi:hypothetical protein
MINGTGTRSSDNKQFGFALTAQSIAAGVADPRTANPNVTYVVIAQHAYLFGMPFSDVEPTHHVHAIKVFPTLTVSLHAFGSVIGSPPAIVGALPNIAADLKMTHAPTLTRNSAASNANPLGQRVADASYKPTADNFWKPNDVISFLGCDTNDDGRPKPTFPNGPYWDFVFDYFIPGIRNETLIDAVVYPRGTRGTRPSFTIPWSPVQADLGFLAPGLTCYREPGQGEYDNIHITPYIGFDDPMTDDPSHPTVLASKYPWIEAPVAADEVIHLHWRWGSAVGSAPPADFLGWQDLSAGSVPLPNKVLRAPLIPPNQSLRIKVAASTDDTADPPSSTPLPMTTNAVTVWYMATAHHPAIGTYSQFFGQGFGLAMYLETLGYIEANWELLTHDVVKPNYHKVRWTGGLASTGQQRVPNGEPSLSRNKLSLRPTTTVPPPLGFANSNPTVTPTPANNM